MKNIKYHMRILWYMITDVEFVIKFIALSTICVIVLGLFGLGTALFAFSLYCLAIGVSFPFGANLINFALAIQIAFLGLLFLTVSNSIVNIANKIMDKEI